MTTTTAITTTPRKFFRLQRAMAHLDKGSKSRKTRKFDRQTRFLVRDIVQSCIEENSVLIASRAFTFEADLLMKRLGLFPTAIPARTVDNLDMVRVGFLDI